MWPFNSWATSCFKETQSKLWACELLPNIHKCIHNGSRFTACVTVVVRKPRISKEGKTGFLFDPRVHFFFILNLSLSSWFGECFINPGGCRNFPSPRGACTPSNEHANPPHKHTPIGVGRFFNWQQRERKRRLLAVWRRACYSSLARVCFYRSVWSPVWAEVRLAAHTTGTPAHVAPITPNH